MNISEVLHIKISASRCAVQVLLNGFPALSVDASWPTFVSPPINPYLIGKGNTLEIEATAPPRPPKNSAKPLEARLIGSVTAVNLGDIVGPEASGATVLHFDLADLQADGRAQFPLRLRHKFDAKPDAFRELCLGPPAKERPADMIAYALRLRDLAESGDAKRMAVEFDVKIQHYAASYGGDLASMRSRFVEFLEQHLLPRLDVDFDRVDVRAVPWCNGRIWELGRWPNLPLFITHPDTEGARYQLPIFVSSVSETTCIVR